MKKVDIDNKFFDHISNKKTENPLITIRMQDSDKYYTGMLNFHVALNTWFLIDDEDGAHFFDPYFVIYVKVNVNWICE